MDQLPRRKFLLRSGVVGATALAAGGGAYTLAEILKTRSWQDRPADAKTLVLVTLYGGNDGLSTVIPYADPAYHDARPELAYQPGEVLHLDAQLGLNPGLKGFADLFRSQRLAIVRGVQYPRPDHSHFRSMDIWQTGSPSHPANTGWVGRWLDATGGGPPPPGAFGPLLPMGPARAGPPGPAGARKPGPPPQRTPAVLVRWRP